MLQGLRTCIYKVSDMDAAKAWYRSILGIAPYFDEPGYVGFNVGGYELGLMLDAPLPQNEGGVLTYWGVDDAHAAYQSLLSLGAIEHTPVSDVGKGILVATVLDPFGNIFGIIQNPHFALP